MNQIKYFALATIVTLTSFAQSTDPVSAGQVGPVGYFAVHHSKSIKLVLPWKVKADLVDTGAESGSQRFYLSVYGEVDTKMDRSEITEIKERFPGYKIDPGLPIRLKAISVDLGSGQPVDISPPAASQNFFTTGWFVDPKIGPSIWQKFANGKGPQVRMEAIAKVPSIIPGETYLLPLREICPKAKSSGTVQGLLGELVPNLQPIYDEIRSAEMKQLALRSALEQCIRLTSSFEIGSIKEVLDLPASTPGVLKDLKLTTDKLGTADQDIEIGVEVTQTVHQ